MGLPPGECAVKATVGLCSMHVPQQSISTHSQERDVGRTPCPQVGGETSALGQDAGTGAESGTSESSCGHFHLVQPCLPLTLVGAGSLGAVPTTGTAGRSWQGQVTKTSKPGRGKLPRAGGEGLSQEESRAWGQWLCHPCEPWSEASLEPSIAQGLRRL